MVRCLLQSRAVRNHELAIWSIRSSWYLDRRRHMSRYAKPPNPITRKELQSLSEIISSNDHSQAQRVWDIWRGAMKSTNDAVRLSATNMRKKMCNYLQESTHNNALDWIMASFTMVPADKLTVGDYLSRIELLFTAGELDAMYGVLAQSTKHLTHSNALNLLEMTVKFLLDSQCKDRATIALSCSYHVFMNLDDALEVLEKKRFPKQEEQILQAVIREGGHDLRGPIKKLIQQDGLFGSIFATDVMNVALRSETTLAPAVWKLKVALNVVSPWDLYHTMHYNISHKAYSKALRAYNAFPNLHTDIHHELMLALYANKKDWQQLQTYFSNLSDYDHLPTLKHYAIVMRAISKIARVDIVDVLFNGLLQDRLKPDASILNAMIYARYALGDTKSVELFFKSFDKFEVAPTSTSYLILMMAYRDARDMTSALSLIHEMADKKDLELSQAIISVFISLCSRRRDPNSALSMIDWLMTRGESISLVVYNSLLHCLAESNRIDEAFELYRNIKKEFTPQIDTVTSILGAAVRLGRMNYIQSLYHDFHKYQMVPDEKWFSVMIHYYTKHRRMNHALQIFEHMRKSGIRASAYHFTILMDGALSMRRPKLAVKLYQRMQNEKISPTFISHAMYIRAKSYTGDEKDYEETRRLMYDFLADDDGFIDLTSTDTPRNVVSPKMLKFALIGSFMHRKPQDAVDLLEHYCAENPQMRNHLQVLRSRIQVHRFAKNWGEVEIAWKQFIMALKKSQVLVQTEPKSMVYQVPHRYAKDFTREINAKIEQLANFGEFSEILRLPSRIRRIGLELTNSNWNTIVRCLLNDFDLIPKAFRLSESHLIKPYVRYVHDKMRYFRESRLQKRVPQPKYKLNVATIRELQQNYNNLLRYYTQKRECSLEEAYEVVLKNFPQTSKLAIRRIQRAKTMARPSIRGGTAKK
ncbi:pentatricopeptide repeat-containing protein Pet309p, mitochondrial [Trichomonascus vanleenenianus]|uniref:Pet309p n=1 Tax=Trichomonascus vanleenenianus TaxID=2268995 RepID=UPI003ECBA176